MQLEMAKLRVMCNYAEAVLKIKKGTNNHVAFTWSQCSTLLDDVGSVWEGLKTGFEGNEGRQMGRKSSSFLKCCN